MSNNDSDVNDNPMELKTSYQWYLEDSQVDILDADGWREPKLNALDQLNYWFTKPILYSEYCSRRNKSTITYYSKKHKSPFGSWNNYMKRANR